MKLSAILIAAIKAAPSKLSDGMLRMVDKMVADWLAQAHETFASDNLEQFSAVVDGVSLNRINNAALLTTFFYFLPTYKVND